MIQRDYFIRILEEFMTALAKFLEKKADEREDTELQSLYTQYVGSYDVLRNLSFDETIRYAREQWPESERIGRLDMLAELLYAEGSYKTNPLRGMLLSKAYRVFDYLEENGTTFSLSRRQKMKKIITNCEL